MKIIPLNTKEDLQISWKLFQEAHSGLFFSADWQQIYEGKDLRVCLILNNNADIIGAFQYLQFKKGLFKLAITPPFCPSIGLHYINPAESVVGRHSFTKDLLTAVAAYFSEQKLHFLDLALSSFITDTQPFTWNHMKAALRYSYWINLEQTEEELWAKLASEKRKSISKAIKDGLVIEQTEDFAMVANLIVDSLNRAGALNNEALIRKIIAPAMRKHALVFTAKQNGDLMAATFCVRDGQKVIYLFGGTTAENRHHGAAVSCMWQTILLAKKQGADLFDFEGSMQPGIEKYFREFGGDLISYAAIEKRHPFLDILMRLRKK